jgi:hypothetical protein
MKIHQGAFIIEELTDLARSRRIIEFDSNVWCFGAMETVPTF